MDSLFFFLLLFAGIAVGWMLGHRSGRKPETVSVPDWIPSVELILEHDADLPLKRLVEVPHLDGDTLDLLMKLGASLREKGEVERAIHLHQTLFARTDLGKAMLQQLELELARDYSYAGLHDRAERLLKDLLSSRSSLQSDATRALIDLYEEEGSWSEIVELSSGRKSALSYEINRRGSHAYCEMAEQALKEGAYADVAKCCRLAIKLDSSCARSFIILAKMARLQGEFNEAIRCYLKALDITPELIAPALEPIVDSFHQVGDIRGMQRYLRRYNQSVSHARVSLALALSVYDEQNYEEAMKALLEDVQQKPSYDGIRALFELAVKHVENSEVSLTHEAYDILVAIQDDEPAYVCKCCGFKAIDFHWRCPSCKEWASQTPFVNGPVLSGPSSIEML